MVGLYNYMAISVANKNKIVKKKIADIDATPYPIWDEQNFNRALNDYRKNAPQGASLNNRLFIGDASDAAPNSIPKKLWIKRLRKFDEVSNRRELV